MRSRVAVFAFVLLAGCGRTGPPGPKYDASQTPPPPGATGTIEPVAQLVLEPMHAAQVQAAGLTGVGCVFVRKGEQDSDWSVITGDGDAHIQRGGVMVAFKADVTTRDLGYLAREIYKGEGLSMQLRFGPGESKVTGEESAQQAGSVTIRGPRGDTVWQAEGLFDCGA